MKVRHAWISIGATVSFRSSITAAMSLSSCSITSFSRWSSFLNLEGNDDHEVTIGREFHHVLPRGEESLSHHWNWSRYAASRKTSEMRHPRGNHQKIVFAQFSVAVHVHHLEVRKRHFFLHQRLKRTEVEKLSETAGKSIPFRQSREDSKPVAREARRRTGRDRG